jgi:hypothetical protein
MRHTALVTLGLLAGCSQAPPEPAPKRVEPPKITQFYADRAEVGPGERALLCYGVESAKEVRITPPVEELKPVFNRCFEVRPESTTEYTLTAAGEDGREATATLSIRRVARASKPAVETPPSAAAETGVSVGMFTANPDRIARGAASTLCYQVTNAERVRVQPSTVQLGAVQRGCFYVTPEQTTTYTLTAEGGGRTATRRATVSVQ